MLIKQNKKTERKIRWNWYSILFLILVNLIIIVFAVIQHWNIANVIWMYWIQSIIIGGFQAKKMLDLKQFSVALPVKRTKYEVVGFFIFHYSLFHLIYMLFINQLKQAVAWDVVLLASFIFFLNHLFSYVFNKKRDSQKVKNVRAIMFSPYIRIIPMHLIIITGVIVSSGIFTLVLFMTLKTVADIIMHITEHKR